MYVKRNSEPFTINTSTGSVDFEVSYVYYPAEPMVLNYGDGTGYDGSPASVEINAIYYDGNDITEVINLYDDFYNEFITEILNYEEA